MSNHRTCGLELRPPALLVRRDGGSFPRGDLFTYGPLEDLLGDNPDLGRPPYHSRGKGKREKTGIHPKTSRDWSRDRINSSPDEGKIVKTKECLYISRMFTSRILREYHSFENIYDTRINKHNTVEPEVQ